MKGAALYHNMLSEILGIGELDDLIQCVLDYGVRKSRRNIRNGCALLLRLLDIGIHKNGAPRSEVNRSFCEQRFFCKILGGKAKRVCKVFDKRTAPRGASLVEQYGIYRSGSELDALHILTANIKHTVHVFIEEGCRRRMRNGFHFTLVKRKGGFEKCLAISRGTGANDTHTAVHLCF